MTSSSPSTTSMHLLLCICTVGAAGSLYTRVAQLPGNYRIVSHWSARHGNEERPAPACLSAIPCGDYSVPQYQRASLPCHVQSMALKLSRYVVTSMILQARLYVIMSCHHTRTSLCWHAIWHHAAIKPFSWAYSIPVWGKPRVCSKKFRDNIMWVFDSTPQVEVELSDELIE